MGKLVSTVTTLWVISCVKTLYFIKYFPIYCKWIFWTIRNYNYEISEEAFNSYLVGG